MRIKIPKQGFENLTKEKVRLIGHLIGDGCVYKWKGNYNIRYEVTDEDLLKQFEADLVHVYGMTPRKGLNPSGKTGRLIPFVHLRSKIAFDDLKKYCEFSSYKWYVPKEIMESDKDLKIEFLRVLFDDEGTVCKNPLRVRLYSVNLSGLEQVKRMLTDSGVISKLSSGYGSKRNVYALVIKNIDVFNKEVGFNSIRKQTKLNELLSQ